MSVTINGTSGLVFSDGTSQASGGYTGFRNRIINGAMMIDQRNAGASVTPADGVYLTDRWAFNSTQASKLSAQQNAGSVTLPAGFTNYLGFTSLSAYSIISSDYFLVSQKIEGLNVSDLAWGTASAASVTLSFKVYSSLTGTFGGAIRNSAANRSYPFSYTVSAANTWTSISITIPGDTSGTWLTTNGIGIFLSFGMGVGSTLSGTAGAWAAANYLSATGATSVVGTNGATFYITGVQLEKGISATPFEVRSYGAELQLCQRYLQKSYNQTSAIGAVTTTGEVRYVIASTAGEANATVVLPVPMRTSPTVTFYSPVTGASGNVFNYSTSANVAMAGANTIGERGWSGGSVGFTATSLIGYQYTVTAEL